MFIFLNDKIVPAAEAVVPVYDHGFLYGDGIYETMRAYKGVVFMLHRHLERLQRSASLIRLQLPDISFIRQAVLDTLDANGLSEAYIRITVSRGAGPIGLDPRLCKEPTLVVITERFKEYPESCYAQGVSVIFARTRRNLAEALNPMIKSLNFLNNILAKVEAVDRGAFEAVMLNAGGFIAEGTVSNVFFARDGVLHTPSTEAGILDGITRETVIGLARKLGTEVKEGLYRPEDILKASEVFLTNTTAEVMPVMKVEDASYGVGTITRALHALYAEKVSDYLRENPSGS